MWTVSKKIEYVLYIVTSRWLPETRHSKIGGGGSEGFGLKE